MTKQLMTNVLELSKDTALRSLSLDFKLREAQELSELRYQQKQSEAKGMTEGMAEGQIIAQKNIARQMLDHGATPDFVCKTSGLSAEAVAELVRKRSNT